MTTLADVMRAQLAAHPEIGSPAPDVIYTWYMGAMAAVQLLQSWSEGGPLAHEVELLRQEGAIILGALKSEFGEEPPPPRWRHSGESAPPGPGRDHAEADSPL